MGSEVAAVGPAVAGSYNVGIGYRALYGLTGTTNIAIGAFASATNPTPGNIELDSTLVIGFGVKATYDNQMWLGNSSQDTMWLGENIRWLISQDLTGLDDYVLRYDETNDLAYFQNPKSIKVFEANVADTATMLLNTDLRIQRGAANQIDFEGLSGNTATFNFNSSATNEVQGFKAVDDTLYIRNNGVDVVIFDEGNMGIGSRLTVSDVVTTQTVFSLLVSHTTDDNIIKIASSDANAYMVFEDNTTAFENGTKIGVEGDDLVFYQDGDKTWELDGALDGTAYLYNAAGNTVRFRNISGALEVDNQAGGITRFVDHMYIGGASLPSLTSTLMLNMNDATNYSGLYIRETGSSNKAWIHFDHSLGTDYDRGIGISNDSLFVKDNIAGEYWIGEFLTSAPTNVDTAKVIVNSTGYLNVYSASPLLGVLESTNGASAEISFMEAGTADNTQVQIGALNNLLSFTSQANPKYMYSSTTGLALAESAIVSSTVPANSVWIITDNTNVNPGIRSVMMGSATGNSNTGSESTLIGTDAGGGAVHGGMSALGYYAGGSISGTGSFGTYIGHKAGQNVNGDYSIFLGADTDAAGDIDIDEAIIIGAHITPIANMDSMIYLGSSLLDTLVLGENMRILFSQDYTGLNDYVLKYDETSDIWYAQAETNTVVDSFYFSGDSLHHRGTDGAISSVPVSLFAPVVDSNGVSSTADFENNPSGGIEQIDLDDSTSTTINLNNIITGITYTAQLYNATNTTVTFASNAAETNFRYNDGTVITSKQLTIAEGLMFTFYFGFGDIWTSASP
jgi:hypothetical protein